MISQLKTYFQNLNAALSTNHASKMEANQRFLSFIAMALVIGSSFMPELAMAAAPAGGNPWDGAATNVLAIFTGGLTRTIAIVAVIACGIAAVAGKLSWDWAIKIIVGIVLIFGAAAIVDFFIAAST